DTFGLPTAADIVANDCVKHVGSVGSGRCPLTDNLLNLVDTVAATTAVEAISFDWFFLFLCFSSFTPYESPIKNFIDVLQLMDCRIERVARNSQGLISFPKQLDSHVLAVDRQCELLV